MLDLIIGLQYGFENKNSVIKSILPNYDTIVRYNDPCNIETVDREDTEPTQVSNIIDKNLIITNNCVIDVVKLNQEIEKLNKKINLIIPYNTHFIQSGHFQVSEGPYLRKLKGENLRFCDVLRDDNFMSFEPKTLFEKSLKNILKYCAYCYSLSGNILYEGRNGFLNDWNHGVYPSASLINIFPNEIVKFDNIIGVFKIYTVKINPGVFPTEIAVTSAKRKMILKEPKLKNTLKQYGWLDLSALKYACGIAKCNKLVLTGLDVFEDCRFNIKICTDYRIDGKIVEQFPIDRLNVAVPVYKDFQYYPKMFISSQEKSKELQDIINFIENYLQLPVDIIL